MGSVHIESYDNEEVGEYGANWVLVTNDHDFLALPEVKPAIEKPRGARMTSQYWKLPVNWRQLIDAVKWAADGRVSLETNAPRTVVAELAEQTTKHELLLHLVNYDVARTPLVRNIEVGLLLPPAKRAGKVMLLSPDEKNSQTVQAALKNGRLTFVVPSMKTYTLATIPLEQLK